MKLAQVFVFVFLLISNNTFCQADLQLKYAETISGVALRKHLTIIASADMEGRATGTRGQQRAQEYIKSQFINIGLKPAPLAPDYIQYYPLVSDTLIPKTFKIGNKKFSYVKDYIISPGSGEGEEFKSKKIVFAGYGITDSGYDDYENKNVEGKVVIVIDGEPKINNNYLLTGSARPSNWSRGLSKKAALAKQKGAEALLVLQPFTDTLPAALVQQTLKSNLSRPDSTNTEKAPAVIIGTSVLKDILNAQELESITLFAHSDSPSHAIVLEKTLKTKLRFKNITIHTNAGNVIGYIEGTDKKDEYVFLTAHYDHLGKNGNVIYYGADDDGSGTVSVIEMAEAFAKAKADGNGPRRSVVFMTVSGEEKGLWGSEYYSNHPVFPLDSTSVDLNTDMVGRIDTERKTSDTSNYIYVIGHNKLSTDLPVIIEGINKRFTNLTLDYKFDDPADRNRIYFRSDHYNFARKGVPVLFFYDGMLLADYHRPTDTVDKINFELMEKRVRLIFLAAWDIANRDAMIKRDMPLPPMTR